MSDEDVGPSWVDRKKRPKPTPLNGKEIEVSRESGMVSKSGTFGKSGRFNNKKVVGHGHSSPYGHVFYQRNQLYKVKALEGDKECTMGFGERPTPELRGSPPTVGPGLYKIVASASGKKSALDNFMSERCDDHCRFTCKVKLPSALVGVPMSSPGPHAKYEVRTEYPGPVQPDERTGIMPPQPFDYNTRRPAEWPEDSEEPGPGHYHCDMTKSTAIAASCPNLSGAGERCLEATGGTKRYVKSTFGMASRFPLTKGTCSPQEDRYYAHSKIWNDEDYLNGARTCGFGAVGKTDFSNPFKGHRDQVSPVTYKPIYSTAYPTSPIDGLTMRNPSPVYAHSKAQSTKNHARKKKMFGSSPSLSPSSNM